MTNPPIHSLKENTHILLLFEMTQKRGREIPYYINYRSLTPGKALFWYVNILASIQV